MNRRITLKDMLFIALLTALYMVLYFVVMAIVMVIGPFGHAISPGICAFISGCVLYFMAEKVGKFGQFTWMTLLVMGAFALMGGAYLPWFITSVTAALIGDAIASRRKNPGTLRLALASGIMHVGQAWGAILPSVLFLEQYKETWVQRGQPPESMDQMIHYTSGIWALISTALVFVLAVAGIFLANQILRKHLGSRS